MDKESQPPQSAQKRDCYRRLAEMYAPRVAFDTQERFFPVDVPSTFGKSRVLRITGDRKHETDHAPVADPATLASIAGADGNWFTTAHGWNKALNDVAKPPYFMPSPADPTVIHLKYAGGGSDAVNAKLTTYATVCLVRDMPNYKGFLDQHSLQNALVQAVIAEGGVLVNYYFFFPAAESLFLNREGDWGGMSVLLTEPKGDDPEATNAVLFCYYKKVRNVVKGSEFFVPGDEGFLTPAEVILGAGPGESVARRATVYVSRGRHNCYAKAPIAATLKSGGLWSASPEKIENGDYQSKPGKKAGAEGTGETEWDWLAGLLFPPLFFLACPATGRRKRTVYQEVPDGIDSPNGPTALPTGTPPGVTSAYPAPTGGSTGGYSEHRLEVQYVGAADQELADLWSYPGYWGAAELEKYSYSSPDDDPPPPPTTVTWGRFGGARRPKLAAWFLWNLYWDSEHGADAASFA